MSVALSPPFERLAEAIRAREATVGVVGQGYVGFAVAQRAAEVGYLTYGVDVDASVVERCSVRNSLDRYRVTQSAEVLRACDVIVVAVPTPTLLESGMRRGDVSSVIKAVQAIAQQIPEDGRSRLLVVESTYAPGTTRTLVLPIVAKHCSEDRLALGYSPERIDPGNGRFALQDIPKVTSGIGERAAALTALFYRGIVDEVVPASSVEAAEATKLLENTFRYVNIALAQEFDEYCHMMGMSAREITRLAATKPFGFMPFYAGAGVGGHCVAEDPYFLYDSMLVAGTPTEVLDAAMRNHEARPGVIVRRLIQALGERPIAGARILLLGVTYKPNVADTRRSPALPIIVRLEQLGATVDYHDPYVPMFAGRASVDLERIDRGAYDLSVLVVEHDEFAAEAIHENGWRPFRISGARSVGAQP
jgi:UDP-N-acetyl-D-glucosamine dehydrogenase